MSGSRETACKEDDWSSGGYWGMKFSGQGCCIIATANQAVADQQGNRAYRAGGSEPSPLRIGTFRRCHYGADGYVAQVGLAAHHHPVADASADIVQIQASEGCPADRAHVIAMQAVTTYFSDAAGWACKKTKIAWANSGLPGAKPCEAFSIVTNLRCGILALSSKNEPR